MTETVTPAVATPAVEPAAVIPAQTAFEFADSSVSPQPGGFVASEQPVPAEEPAAEVPAEVPAETPAEEPTAETPADTPAEEPAAEEPKATELDTDVWGDTQSDVGNSVLGMLQDSGISPDDAKVLLFDAIQAGDATKIDMDALTAKVGKNAATIIASGAKSYISENNAKQVSILSTVHDAAGGEANWNTARDWAKANMDAATLKEYIPLIDKGGASARFATAEVLAAYNASGENSTLAPAPRAEPTSVSPPASTATTRAEYVAALEKANRTRQGPKVIAAIQAARNLGRQQGI